MFKQPKDVVRGLIPGKVPPGASGEAFAPANIALCKYWGKRDEALKLPVTGSLSVSLGGLGTRMRIEPSDRDALILNGDPQPAGGTAVKRLFAFLDLFRDFGLRFRVESHNTLPMAAGLASSASAFAAAVGALDDLYGWGLSAVDKSVLARLGSGSACRSVYEGFVEWVRGERDDGMDSHALRLDVRWPEFRIGILTLSDAEKAVGSSEGMRRTVNTASLYQSWPAQVERDLPVIRRAVLDRDFPTLGRAAENNALAMHATMIAAWPPVIYWRPETVEALHRVHALRAQGLELYATMDAGPNVKLLFPADAETEVLTRFPNLHTVAPMGTAGT